MQDHIESGSRRKRKQGTICRSYGHFVHLMGMLNKYIERENKYGADIPRFTKNQIRLILRYLRNHRSFDAPATEAPTMAQFRAFRSIVAQFNKGLPSNWEKKFMQ